MLRNLGSLYNYKFQVRICKGNYYLYLCDFNRKYDFNRELVTR